MITATYHAPQGDNEVVHMRGVRFIDGQPVDIDPDVHAALIGKLVSNRHFEVTGVEELTAPPAKGKRG